VELWLPADADLGDDAVPPSPDRRVLNFIGLDGRAHTGYRELQRRSTAWPTTGSTPAGPAGLLATCRDCFTQAYYAYALFAVAGTWSIFAVEAGLRAKLGADRRAPFRNLVKQATAQGLLSEPAWQDGRLDTGRELRNRAVHGDQQAVWTPPLSERVIGASHEAVAALFPD